MRDKIIIKQEFVQNCSNGYIINYSHKNKVYYKHVHVHVYCLNPVWLFFFCTQQIAKPWFTIPALSVVLCR